jgi:hypothetical protein
MGLDSLTVGRLACRVKGQWVQPRICGEMFGVMEVNYHIVAVKYGYLLHASIKTFSKICDITLTLQTFPLMTPMWRFPLHMFFSVYKNKFNGTDVAIS